MNQVELKQFWGDVADGIFCASLMGWSVDSVEGTQSDFKVVFSATGYSGEEAEVTITRVSAEMFKLVAVVGGEEKINGEYGANQSDFADEQEMVDMISHAVDDALFDEMVGGGEEF